MQIRMTRPEGSSWSMSAGDGREVFNPGSAVNRFVQIENLEHRVPLMTRLCAEDIKGEPSRASGFAAG
jgi:hypothetical protein